jgi:hypothetical protein
MDPDRIRPLDAFSHDPELFVRVVLGLPRFRLCQAGAEELEEGEAIRARLADDQGQRFTVIVTGDDLPAHLRSTPEIQRAKTKALEALERHNRTIADCNATRESAGEDLEDARARLSRAEHDVHLTLQRLDAAAKAREKADTVLRLALDDVAAFA